MARCTVTGAFDFNVDKAKQYATQGTSDGDFAAAAMYYSAAMSAACLNPRRDSKALLALSVRSRKAYAEKVQVTANCPECPTGAPGAPRVASAGGPGGEEDQCPTDFKPFDASKALTFDQIIGLESVKERAREDVVTPMKFPVIAREQKLQAPNVLLYGLGGTGKTVLVEAIARDTGTTIYEVSAGQIKGKFVGQSEKCLEKLLELGKQGDGAIIFLDEVDSLLAGEGDIERAFQAEFKNVVQTGKDMPPPVIMAATNVPWRITDGAIQRRFGLKLYIALPTPEQRIQYLKMLAGQLKDCKGQKRNLDNITVEQWVQLREMTKGFTPDNLRVLLETTRRANPKSLSQEADLFFCKQANDTYTVLLASEASGQTGCTKGLTSVPPDDRSKVCWPLARFQDFDRVLKKGMVRTTVTVRELNEFLEYAQSVKDFGSIASIQRSIVEMERSEE